MASMLVLGLAKAESKGQTSSHQYPRGRIAFLLPVLELREKGMGSLM